MNERYLLDTNAIIAALRYEPLVVRRLMLARELMIPSVALGELYHGAHKSLHVAANVARYDAIAHHNAILPCDAETASAYGTIKADLEARGHRITDNDMWIAALARQHGLTLLTRDTHFDRISSLDVEQW